MTFAEWKQKNSIEYKGHVISLGSITKDGEPCYMFYAGLGEDSAEVLERGKRIIDEAEQKRG